MQRYKVLGYSNDIKPAITSMNEFNIVEKGSALFEAASDWQNKVSPPGKVEQYLQQEDLPVQYIAISEHLDMVGVQLKATSTQTEKSIVMHSKTKLASF